MASDVDDDADLVRRARMHAALGEPLRLRLVDELTLADASPGELGAIVDLPTNLLAFHLKVLDDAGIVRRLPSEGDRRRSYVQLCWEDDEVSRLVCGAVELAGRVPRVMFVCTHNSARSKLAEALWRTVSGTPATSAGTDPAAAVHPRAAAVARRHGLALGRAKPRLLADTVAPDDLLVAVCDSAHESLTGRRRSPSTAGAPSRTARRSLHWAVPDPVLRDTDLAFEEAYVLLEQRIQRLASALDGTAPAVC